MLEAWTGEVKARCHVMQITLRDVADSSGYSLQYLSEVLNGRGCTESTKNKIFSALDRLEEKIRKEEAHEDHSKSDSPGRS